MHYQRSQNKPDLKAFVENAADIARPAHPRADCAIVFSGRTARLERGLRLFTAYNLPVFFSGHDIPQHLGEIYTVQTSLDALHPDLVFDLRARTTAQNADHAAAWMKEKGFASALLVTDKFHMPRANHEMKIAAQNVGLTATFQKVRLPNSLDGDVTLRVRVLEPWKYLMSLWGKRRHLEMPEGF